MIEKDELSLRLDGITSAQQRSRAAFFLAAIAAVIVLIVSFNVTFSQSAGRPVLSHDFHNDVLSESLIKERVKHYFDHFYYSVPLLGVQVSTDDLALYAPLSLLIFAFYHLSCIRAVFAQLEDLSIALSSVTDQQEIQKVAIILKSETVLNTLTSELPFRGRWSGVSRFLSTVNLYRLLIYLPAFASIAALYADIYGTYFSGGALDNPGAVYFAGLSYLEKTKTITAETIGLVATLVTVIYGFAASKYASGIRIIIDSVSTLYKKGELTGSGERDEPFAPR